MLLQMLATAEQRVSTPSVQSLHEVQDTVSEDLAACCNLTSDAAAVVRTVVTTLAMSTATTVKWRWRIGNT